MLTATSSFCPCHHCHIKYHSQAYHCQVSTSLSYSGISLSYNTCQVHHYQGNTVKHSLCKHGNYFQQHCLHDKGCQRLSHHCHTVVDVKLSSCHFIKYSNCHNQGYHTSATKICLANFMPSTSLLCPSLCKSLYTLLYVLELGHHHRIIKCH